MLWRDVPAASRWLFISTAAWMLGLSLSAGLVEVVSSIGSIVALGLVGGAIIGPGLVRLLR